MLRKNCKNVTSETNTSVTKTSKSDFSSLPTAKSALEEVTKIQESMRNDFPVLTQEEIVYEMEKGFRNGFSNVDFFNMKITEDDKMALENLGYNVEVYVSQYASLIHIRISWEK